MNYECYFCHHDISQARASNKAKIFDCIRCSSRHKLHRVITVWDEYDRLLYAHMYPRMGVEKNAGYHIRLHLQENYTYVGWNESEAKTILTLPGYPMQPSNVNEKLKLYLLFS